MRDYPTFTLDWAYVKAQAREACRIYFAPLKWCWERRRITLPLLALAVALALTGCATTRYVTIGCLTQSQYDQLAAAKPGKIHSQLNGAADHDLKLIAGRLIRVEAWGDGELTILGGCITKDAH